MLIGFLETDAAKIVLEMLLKLARIHGMASPQAFRDAEPVEGIQVNPFRMVKELCQFLVVPCADGTRHDGTHAGACHDIRQQILSPERPGDTDVVNTKGRTTAEHQGRPAIDPLGVLKHFQFSGGCHFRNRVVANEFHGRLDGIQEFTHQPIGAAARHGVKIGIG